jgi:nicotinamidase-related amidase
MAPETTSSMSLPAHLLQKTPKLPTRKGLIIMNLQYDAVSPDRQLSIIEPDFLGRIKSFTSAFRHHGDLIWIRTERGREGRLSTLHGHCCSFSTEITHSSLLMAESHLVADNVLVSAGSQFSLSAHTAERPEYPPPRMVNSPKQQTWPDPSREDVLSPSPGNGKEPFRQPIPVHEPCCIESASVSSYVDQVEVLIQPRDLQIVKSYNSAFSSTSLLHALRSNLVTELFVCGSIADGSLYATVMDAARYGMNVVLVQDCLGHRTFEEHNLVVQRLVDMVGADATTSDRAIGALRKSSWDLS